MSNEFKVVPVEPTPEMVGAFSEMLEAVDDGCSSSGKDLLRKFIATIAAAPQPPALGGESEVLAWLDLEKLKQGGMAYATQVKVNHRQTDLIDRAHLAPLQAEIERLKDNVRWRAVADEQMKIIDQLKARCDEVENLLLDLVTQHDLPIAARNLCNVALSKPAGIEQS